MRQGARDVASGVGAAVSGESGAGCAARAVVIIGIGEHAPPVLFGVGADVSVCPVGLDLRQRRKLLGGVVSVNRVTGGDIAAQRIDLGGHTRGTTGAIQQPPMKITLRETEHGPVLDQRAGTDQNCADPAVWHGRAGCRARVTAREGNAAVSHCGNLSGGSELVIVSRRSR
jgi:hypothetical protein